MVPNHLFVLAIAAALILAGQSKPEDSLKNANQLGTLGTRPVLKSPGVGSTNKSYAPFDDLKRLSNTILKVRSITIAAFYELDSLQLAYTMKDGSIYRPPPRGEGFTVPETIKLAKDEYVSKIEGTTVYNNSFGQVLITINNPNNFKSRVYGTYGANVGERDFSFEGYILGIHGKTGPSFSRQILRNLGVYSLAPVEESEYFGMPLSTFYENPDMWFPPVVKISKIYIFHGDRVNSLQAEYQLLDGSTRLGGRIHGGDRGSRTTISLKYGEELIGLKVGVHEGISPTVTQLTFISRSRDGSTVVYGPFGKSGNKTTTVHGHILGFTGGGVGFLFSLKAFYYV